MEWRSAWRSEATHLGFSECTYFAVQGVAFQVVVELEIPSFASEKST